MLELGNVCNLHCKMCPREYTYGQVMDKGFMDLENAYKIIDEIYPFLDSIGLTGLGETFLYPHLLEVVKYIKQKKKSIIITVSTNAHIKNYIDIADKLIPYIDNIQFSVDGIGKTYENIRPNTSFDEIRRNIEHTVKKGKTTTFMINCVVMPENYKGMGNIVRFADELNIKFVNFNTASIASNPSVSRSYYDFFQSEEFKKEVEKLAILSKEFPHIEITGLEQKGSLTFQDCTFPWEYPYITWNGYYVPCCGKPFPKLLNFGNVFEEGVMNVLNSEKARAFRKAWQANKPPRFCHNCQFTEI